MILVLGGTHETKTVCKILNESGLQHILSVATDLGKTLYESIATHCIVTRFDEASLTDFIKANDIKFLIDATHPHALLVSDVAKKAALNSGIPYMPFQRAVESAQDKPVFSSMTDAIEHIKELETDTTRILITGVKHASEWAASFDTTKLIFRIMPSLESLDLCLKAGIPVENIIAVKAPCSADFNRVLFSDYGISHFVFKNSGSGSAYTNNLQSVEDTAVTPIIIQISEPISQNGNSEEMLRKKLKEMEGIL